MNANAIIEESMSLEQKLAAIDKVMLAAQEQSNEERSKMGLSPIPIDPSLATICDSCE